MSQATTGVSRSTQNKLANLYEEYHDIMRQIISDKEFDTDDIQATNQDYLAVIKKLEGWGAVKNQGQRLRENPDGGGDYVTEWRWHTTALEKIRTVAEQRKTLPCGHRGHIFHRKGGGLGCKYCDQRRDYDKKTVLEAMPE